MDKFLEYWKKGWKVWVMMICIHLSYLLLLLPVALILIHLVGKESKDLYYPAAIIVGLIFAPAITYYIFTLFYGEQ